MNILALDIGTTSMRGILYDPEGRQLASAGRLTPLLFPDGYIEQDPLFLKEKLFETVSEIATRYPVDAISLTAYRSSPALFDEEGSPLTNFIMWQDTRNKDICERIEHLNGEVYRKTGAKVNAVFAASKLTWFKEHMRKEYDAAYKALVVPAYLINTMTGAFSADTTYGSRTGVMNIHSLEYDREMLSLYDLDIEKLPDLVDVGSIAGYTSEAFREATGVRRGIPVITAGGDQQDSALGMGELDDESLVINCGTGSFIISLVDRPYLENETMICNVSAIPGRYVLESNVLASAAALNWMLKELFPEIWNDGKPDYGAFHRIVSRSAPGAGGVRIVPLFQGCGSRDWNPDARAHISNLSLGSTRADLGMGMLEGIAAEIAKSVDSLPEKSRNVSRVYIGGGLTNSDLFDQILCDMLGKQLVRYDDAQATAMGAWISAAVTLGLYPGYRSAFEKAREGSQKHVYEPDAGLHAFYRKVMDDTEEIYRSLR